MPIYLHCALRHLRARRDDLAGDRNRLQLRYDTHENGATLSSLQALDAELYLLEESIAFLWREYFEAGGRIIPPPSKSAA